MLFTAYFDESDTHKPKPDVIMAALFGDARQWRLLERKLKRLRQRYGFTIFHAKEFKAEQGEFAGWSQTKRAGLPRDLAGLIRDGLRDSFLVTLPWEKYQSEYRNTPTPRKMKLDSQYGVCFRSCLNHMILTLLETRQSHKLRVVIEDGHKNVGDTVRIFNEIKAELEFDGTHLLDTITVAKKEESEPLMIADFQAHLWSISNARIRMGLPGYNDMVKGPAPKGQASMSTLIFPPNYFRDQKANWELRKQEKMARWRVKRDARRAAKVSVDGESQP